MLLSLLLLAAGQPASPVTAEPITDRSSRAERIRRFQQDLTEVGVRGRVSTCSTLLRLRHGGRQALIGGICEVEADGRRRTLLMCNDDGIGHFALATTFPHDPDWVARFARVNCLDGGWED